MFTISRQKILFMLCLVIVVVGYHRALVKINWGGWGSTGATVEKVPSNQPRVRQETEPTIVAPAEMGLGYLAKARETGSGHYYGLAANAFDEALAFNPNQLDARIGQAMLAASLHNFAEALTLADAILDEAPNQTAALGVRVDALVELGRYDEAVVAVDRMASVKPGLDAYSRVSYLRELHGDIDGAIVAMARAVAAGEVGTEPYAWAAAQLGHLFILDGDWVSAETIFNQTLTTNPNFALALEGQAELAHLHGDDEEAIAILTRLLDIQPMPHLAIFLGDLYADRGESDAADSQYELAEFMFELQARAGVQSEAYEILFKLKRGSAPSDLIVEAEELYERQPTIFSADSLAWVHFQAGKQSEAEKWMQEAVRLGTQDPLLLEHAAAVGISD